MPCYHLTLKLTLLPLLGPDFGTKLTLLPFELDFFFFVFVVFFLASLPLVVLVVFLVVRLLLEGFRGTKARAISSRMKRARNCLFRHIVLRSFRLILCLGNSLLTVSLNKSKSFQTVLTLVFRLTRDYPPHAFYEFSTQPHSS